LKNLEEKKKSLKQFKVVLGAIFCVKEVAGNYFFFGFSGDWWGI
jgi:hypothetical protein